MHVPRAITLEKFLQSVEYWDGSSVLKEPNTLPGSPRHSPQGCRRS